jgi:hypothetical protein
MDRNKERPTGNAYPLPEIGGEDSSRNYPTLEKVCKRGLVVTLASIALVMIIPAMAVGGTALTRIKIDRVPDEYTPANATVSEPVSMEDFHFEVNQETRRARLVVDYSYSDEIVYAKNDAKRGPQPTVAQPPGLKYDSQAHTIVYEADGKQTVCARVYEHKRLFGRHLRIQKTGSCLVTTEDKEHAEDDGWRIRRFRAIDTYFEVHGTANDSASSARSPASVLVQRHGSSE